MDYTSTSFSSLLEDSIGNVLLKKYQTPITSVFISPKCRISRDVVRNDYKIVRSPDKADAYVLPMMKKTFWTKTRVAVYSRSNECFYVYQCNKESGLGYDDKDFDFSSMKHDIINALNACFSGTIDIYHNDDMSEFSVFCTKKNNDLPEIVNGFYPSRRYIFENTLPVNPPTSIDIQTLEIWRHMDDNNLLAKAISMSNWRDFPFTVCWFIHHFAWRISGIHSSDTEFMLDAIDYYDYDDENTETLYNRMISPDDWNLVQKYLLYRLNLPETGGFRNTGNKTRRLSCQNLLRERSAVAPMLISVPQPLGELVRTLNQ